MKNFTLFAGSLRAESFNKKLVFNVKNFLDTQKIENTTLDLKTIDLPVLDQDIEKEIVPQKVQKVGDQIAASQGIIISTPEYNGSISSPLKNFIDWTSRMKQQPWELKPVLLLGATPGALGAIRGLWHTRQPFTALNAIVYPEVFGLPKAHEAFDEKGNLKDAKTAERLEALVKKFVGFAGKI